jgi:hypothetical protein
VDDGVERVLRRPLELRDGVSKASVDQHLPQLRSALFEEVAEQRRLPATRRASDDHEPARGRTKPLRRRVSLVLPALEVPGDLAEEQPGRGEYHHPVDWPQCRLFQE